MTGHDQNLNGSTVMYLSIKISPTTYEAIISKNTKFMDIAEFYPNLGKFFFGGWQPYTKVFGSVLEGHKNEAWHSKVYLKQYA